MVAVLDQYEIEYKETYISGTYDQVVMGKMFYPVTIGGIKKYVYGNRGVVYGAINSDQAPNPGTGLLDFSNSFSYRLQPYREKAGNCKAAKHTCYEERIYDTVLPDPISCFKINGASISMSNATFTEGIAGAAFGGIDVNNGIIMFDNHVPDQNGNTKNLNVAVDRHWTKSYPFEPRYSAVYRQKKINFSCEASYILNFASSTVTALPIKQKLKSLIVGTVGRNNINRSNKPTQDLNYSSPESGGWKHHWAADTVAITILPTEITGSAAQHDLIKTIFGFGDSTSTFFDSQIKDSNNPTGYALRGTNNWPEFRARNNTKTSVGYEAITGSFWNFGPIIRGWKYGLHNGLPDFSSAYFRQGKYGQFRDMLEQRSYTTFVNGTERISTKINSDQGPITVKFLDSNENLTDAVNTHSQNLSMFATSSLPYFDLQQRNRRLSVPLSNISLINFSLDNAGNITI